MKTQKANRIISVLLYILILISLIPNIAIAAGDITVTVKVENTTFLETADGAEPAWTGTKLDCQVTVPLGSTVADATIKAFDENGITEKGLEENYIYEIDGLAAFDAGFMSGWMVLLNDWFINEGAGDIVVEDGDIICWAYSSEGFGADLGGTWDNDDTSLKDLVFSVGNLSPAFKSDVFSYTLTVPAGTTDVKVTPTATNKNFQVRTNVNGIEYKRTQTIPVEDGTVIKVGCGDPSWPTMNTAPILTEYTIMVVVETEPLDPINVKIRIEGYDKTHITYTDVNVTNYNFADYGLNITDVAKDTITPLHALIKLLYDIGYDINDDTINLTSTGMITTIFGEGDSYRSWMYSVNGKMPTGDTGPVTKYKLNEGDSIVFFCVDWMYAYQSWFDKEEVEIYAGESVELTLSGINLMNWMFYEDETVEAIKGAELYITDGTNMVSADKPTGVITDENGKPNLTFDVPGTYLISASRLSEYDDETIDISRPYCKVIVYPIEEPVTLPELPSEWSSFRGNTYNMGVTDKATPRTAEQSELKWAQKYSGTFVTPNIPCIVDGNLIFTAGANIYKVNKQTGELIISKPMAAAPSFGICPLTYGGGMVFAQISNGRIQAFNADTLESLWVSEPMGGQSLSPIVYSNGYVYTGFWTGETADNSYVCLSVTDEDPNNPTEEKKVKWKHTVKGGFYWAGGVVLDDYIIVGSDDGTSGSTGTSKIYSLNRFTGKVKDTLDIIGDQRSTIAYNEADGGLYFTTKAGYIYSVKYITGGTFDKVGVKSKEIQSGWQATGTPVVYKGKLYIGIGQGFDNGKLIVADTDTLNTIYEVPLKGYPQGSALLSKAYEEETGKVYIYIAYNKNPGGLTVIEDSADQTTAVFSELFTPADSQAQYSLGSPICDNDGTIYYHNDSATIFAIANKKSESQDPEKLFTSIKIERNGTTIPLTKEGESSYSATVANSYSSIYVIPSVVPGAKVLVNNQELLENKSAINLSVGTNTIIVTATKGNIIQTLTIVVIRNSSSGGSSGGDKEIPGFGKIVGKVHVSMKNETFREGDFTGTIFSESNFDFAENDTMMTIVLRALAKNGYGWTGQGGSMANGVNDYTISYLASITKNNKSLGEFSGGPGSGWMGALNDWFVNEGFQQFKPKSGDVISIEYTTNLGVDLGAAWNDPDTSLKSLSISQGTLSPEFSPKTLKYTLTLPAGTNSVSFTPSAKNRNYLIKIFKNEKVTTNVEGASFYRYSNSIPVKDGDIIYIGVGETAWPSMNSQRGGTTNYSATWYEIKISSSSGGTSKGGTKVTNVTTAPTPTPTTAPNDSSSWQNPYMDVSTTDWFYSAIKYCTENGIMQGVEEGVFSPETKVTRAMLVTMLYRYEKASVEDKENTFVDVENDKWYTDAIIWATQNGIVEGYGSGLFAPNDYLTREQIVTVLYRYATKIGLDVSQEADLSTYTDAGEISDWAHSAMKWANAIGLLKGRTDTTLAPKGTANRAEVATLIMRFVEDVLK
jgi:hypothetical protein